jgi:hypothetical protein
MDRLQRQQSKCCCRRLVDSLLLSKIQRRVCTGRTLVVRSIVLSPLFLIISLQQTSQTQLSFGANQGIHHADHEVSSILVVSSIPCCSPHSNDDFVPVARRSRYCFLTLVSRHSSLIDVRNAAPLNRAWRRKSNLHPGVCRRRRHSSLFCVYYPFGIRLFSHLCFSLFLFDRRSKRSASARSRPRMRSHRIRSS